MSISGTQIASRNATGSRQIARSDVVPSDASLSRMREVGILESLLEVYDEEPTNQQLKALFKHLMRAQEIEEVGYGAMGEVGHEHEGGFAWSIEDEWS